MSSNGGQERDELELEERGMEENCILSLLIKKTLK